MTRISLKKLALAAAALTVATFAGAAMPGTASTAEARTRVVIVAGGLPLGLYAGGYDYDDCRWLKRRAIHTGSSYWWSRYHACRGY
jgi:hypothetical protein